MDHNEKDQDFTLEEIMQEFSSDAPEDGTSEFAAVEVIEEESTAGLSLSAEAPAEVKA